MDSDTERMTNFFPASPTSFFQNTKLSYSHTDVSGTGIRDVRLPNCPKPEKIFGKRKYPKICSETKGISRSSDRKAGRLLLFGNAKSVVIGKNGKDSNH